MKETENGEILIDKNSLRLTIKTNWGIYKFEGNNLEIQHWLPSKSCHEVQTLKGNVVNDSTFVITSFVSTKDSKVNEVKATYKFVPFSLKADSIVSFIP